MYDLVIVGGGPAGSSACRKANQLGLRSLLIEKKVFPRYKPCGGAVSEQALSYLDYTLPPNILEREVFGARVHFRNRLMEQKKPYRIATLVTRSVFDDYLLRKAVEAGGEVVMGQKVTGFRESADRVEVLINHRKIETKYLLIAEGAQGPLKNIVRKKDSKTRYGICVVTEIPEENRLIDEYISKAIDIHFGLTDFGYGWIFPHDNYFSVGIGGLARNMPDPRKKMDEFLKSNGFGGETEMKVHRIPVGGVTRRLATNRVILCGDAAGFVDSFYGEGIAYAIRSGQIAAETVYRRMNNWLKETGKYYESECLRSFGNSLKYSLYLSRLMHRYPGIMYKIFTSRNKVLDKFLDVPAKRLGYKEYMQWLIPRVPAYWLMG